MSSPLRPVIGPHPRTLLPTEWPSGKAAAASWGVSRACIRQWLLAGREGWSYADGRAEEQRHLGSKPCKVCDTRFRQRQDERDHAFRRRLSCSEDCRRELLSISNRGRTWSTRADTGGLPTSTLDRAPLTPDDGAYWT